jgi:O-antigen/teichoic acid export membrane protein
MVACIFEEHDWDDEFVSKAAEMAKVSARGGFHLFWGLVASSVISAVGVILVARLLSPSEYGLYTIALTAPNLIATFRDWGVNSAIIKFAAQYRSEEKPANVKNILAAGLIFETALGLTLSLISFLLSGFLATNIFQRPDLTPLIQVASFIILTGALLTAAQSTFTGTERMELNSITLVFKSTIKTLIVPLFVVLGLGVYGATMGTTIASLIAGLISMLLLWMIYRNYLKPNSGRLEIVENIKVMFKYGLPLSISAILSGFLMQFYNFLIAIYATDLMIGNYAVAANFVVLISFFSTPITTLLFPAFSKLDSRKEEEMLQNVFQFSVKYAALIVVPVATAIITLAQPAVATLFGEEYEAAPLFLALLAIPYLYSALGNLSTRNLINSQGETKFNLKLTIITSAVGLALSLILIPQHGIIGLLITALAAGIPSLIIALHWIKNHYNVTVDWISSAKILVSSAAAAVITYIILFQLSFSSWMKLIIGGTIFLFVFLTITLAIRTINKSDIGNLREMVGALGPLSHLLNFLLNIIEKLTDIFQF